MKYLVTIEERSEAGLTVDTTVSLVEAPGLLAAVQDAQATLTTDFWITKVEEVQA